MFHWRHWSNETEITSALIYTLALSPPCPSWHRFPCAQLLCERLFLGRNILIYSLQKGNPGMTKVTVAHNPTWWSNESVTNQSVDKRLLAGAGMAQKAAASGKIHPQHWWWFTKATTQELCIACRHLPPNFLSASLLVRVSSSGTWILLWSWRGAFKNLPIRKAKHDCGKH